MALGDIVYMRTPIELDAYGVEDTVLNTVFAGKFDISVYEQIKIHVANITGNGGKAKAVLVVVAQDNT